MQLIDNTYFVGDIRISQDEFKQGTLDLYIARVEKAILVKLLGYDLYKAFAAAIDGGTPAQKWVDLKEGVEYQVENEDGVNVYVKWEGFVNTELVSLLSYFTYFFYVSEGQSLNTITGDVILNNENSETTPIGQLNSKLVRAYNKGVELYGKDITLLNGQNAMLRSKTWQRNIDYSKTIENYYEEIIKGTAFNYIYFMNDQNGDSYYPNWQFTEINKINTFGI